MLCKINVDNWVKKNEQGEELEKETLKCVILRITKIKNIDQDNKNKKKIQSSKSVNIVSYISEIQIMWIGNYN